MSERILVPVHDPMEQEWAEKFWPEKPENYGDGKILCPRCGAKLFYRNESGIDRYKRCDYCPDCGQHIDWSFGWEDEDD